MIKRYFNDYLFPAVICILLAINIRGEYRDNGIRGVLEILVGAIILFIVVFGGIALLFRWWLRRHNREST